MSVPNLAITIGDPAGIGAEIILKALADPYLQDNCQITVVGNRFILQTTYEHLLQNSHLKPKDLIDPQDLAVIDLPWDKKVDFGKGSAATGRFSFACLEKAIALTLTGKFQGIVTAPIAKFLWKAAGYDYPGQTEVLASKARVDKFGMLFIARSPHTNWQLCTLLATTHLPLAQVPQALTPKSLSEKLSLLIDCLAQDFGIEKPKIAIAGLNPHSGEAGELGTEERDWLNAWLADERTKYPQAELVGLVPPDTMWVKPGQAWYGTAKHGDEAADAYLALYHDQGLIPVKLMAFDRAINTTIGLPFVRTSPDHGTAFDIAGRGIADPNSIIAAIDLATKICIRRGNQ